MSVGDYLDWLLIGVGEPSLLWAVSLNEQGPELCNEEGWLRTSKLAV